MKKFTIIGFIVALMIASVVLWHIKHPSDTQLGRQIIGTWTQAGILKITISSDGNFLTRLGLGNNISTYQGTWLVKDKEFVMTVKNVKSTENYNAVTAGSVGRLKIIHVDKNKFIYEKDGETMTLIRIGR